MGEKIVVGPKFGGLVNAVQPFAIDNDSFPYLLNAYEWRGKIKRKRGTSQLGRLQRYFNSQSALYNAGNLTLTLDATGFGNLVSAYRLSPDSAIVPGSIHIVGPVGPVTYTDPTEDGYLTPTGTGGLNTINYASGAIKIPAQANQTITATFIYYPSLPVMGLKGLNLDATQFPETLAFDTVYSYNILTTFPNNIYDVSFYKNPPSAMINGFAYTAKTTATPTTWNGQDYQQFWNVNYQNAFWVTNGIPVPFVGTNLGMQFQIPVSITWLTAQTVNFDIDNCPLVVGDWVFINEVTTGGNPATTLNFQTGFVSSVLLPIFPSVTSTVTVTFPYAEIANEVYADGIVQYLTNRSDPTVDCLRWYDGDPTNGSSTAPIIDRHQGWVNFAPPLSNLQYSIGDLPLAQYYLIGARMIIAYKDRLLFFGPVVQTSSPNSQRYLQDTIIYSQNGTAFYTCSFDGTDPIGAQTTFFALLTPGTGAAIDNETATANAYWEDQTGLGGYISAGFEQPITTVSPNEDVIIVGFNSRQARLIYSGNDVLPFNFYVINSELGSASTFSTINLDRGVLTTGEHGFVLTSQIGAQRFDLQIPDALFEFSLQANGTQRVTAQRDFINEWIYFTYCSNQNNYPGIANKFPNQTLQYNYREETWATFNENYTTYGQFRHATGLTWETVGDQFPTWEQWNEPWSAGSSTLLQPKVIAGNPQGFVIQRDEGTGEANSIYISNISFPSAITGATAANPVVLTSVNSLVAGQSVSIMGVVGMTQLNNHIYEVRSATPTTVTLDVDGSLFTPYISGGIITPTVTIYSPNHSLVDGDYITINNALGTIAPYVNKAIFSVSNPSPDGFNLDPVLTTPGTYLGNGTIQRMYVPLIQSKQFNPAWAIARKTRIGVQQYLLTRTSNGQITLLIFLSQNPIGSPLSAYNIGTIVPDINCINNTLIYSATLYTCPESSNLGLTPPNTNLQMVTALNQEQIWHRINTSLLGDTIQVAFTMSDAQMRDTTFSNQFSEIELHCFVIDATPSQILA